MGRRLYRVAAWLSTVGVMSSCMLLPGEERKIARRLDELAEAASVNADESPVIRAAGGARIGRYFTEHAVIQMDADAEPIQGRDTVVALASQARAAAADLKVRFTDVEIRVPDSGTATAHLTLIVSGRSQVDAGDSTDGRELALTLQKIDGDWLISRAETLRTLQRPE